MHEELTLMDFFQPASAACRKLAKSALRYHEFKNPFIPFGFSDLDYDSEQKNMKTGSGKDYRVRLASINCWSWLRITDDPYFR